MLNAHAYIPKVACLTRYFRKISFLRMPLTNNEHLPTIHQLRLNLLSLSFLRRHSIRIIATKRETPFTKISVLQKPIGRSKNLMKHSSKLNCWQQTPRPLTAHRYSKTVTVLDL